MKNKKQEVFRWGLLLCSLAYIIACRYHSGLAEDYARNIYPYLSAALSTISSLFPFPLEEPLVIAIILWAIFYLIREKKKGTRWYMILLRETEAFVCIYVWFYLGWGLNYFRQDIYTRLHVSHAVYEEQAFEQFLNDYTGRLNASYRPQTEVPPHKMKEHVHAFYSQLSPAFGLATPHPWQQPKEFIFTSLYSKVGVLGSMGPFLAEAQLNADLLEVQYPFTYAHEFAHLLGVSNEAEANYWAYLACTESGEPALQYCGYFGLFPHVLSNASHLLSEERFTEWIRSIRPEIKEQYNQKNAYWKEHYSPVIGEVQSFVYDLFLKGNKISSGKKNYAEVIGMLLALKDYSPHP